MEPRCVRRVSRFASAPFTSAFGQQNFIDRDHNAASKLADCGNHNAPGRCGEAAAPLPPSKASGGSPLYSFPTAIARRKKRAR